MSDQLHDSAVLTRGWRFHWKGEWMGFGIGADVVLKNRVRVEV